MDVRSLERPSLNDPDGAESASLGSAERCVMSEKIGSVCPSSDYLGQTEVALSGGFGTSGFSV
jgi:hypothetical protein